MDAALVVVHAGNSQGKTSLAEALEFLISGRSSRRDLLGGAKAEYNDSLRNAHMAADDAVYVEAVVRSADGVTHQVRRELLCDFGAGSECESRLLLDGAEVTDLDEVGVVLADPPMRAPVLLQHTLRHVLSTEPKQRVGYFKALLSLNDLDYLRDRLKAVRTRAEAEQPGTTLNLVSSLSATPAAPAGAAIAALLATATEAIATEAAVTRALLDAGAAVLDGHAGANRPENLGELDRVVEEALEAEREQLFPLASLTTGASIESIPTPPNVDDYARSLDEADRQTARLAPVIEALLAIDNYGALTEPIDCPICGTEHALGPDQLAVLREQLARTHALGEAARIAVRALGDARRDLNQLDQAIARTIPEIAAWTKDQLTKAEDLLRGLGGETSLVTDAAMLAAAVATAAEEASTVIADARTELDKTLEALASREQPPGDLTGRYIDIDSRRRSLDAQLKQFQDHVAGLRAVVEVASRPRVAVRGLADLADLLARRADLVTDVLAEAKRRRHVKRLNAADKALREAAGRVLDDRFAKMGEAITSWWSTIRPDELVSFGGIKRRAGGALFVNLVAALRTDLTSDPVEREALGVYSDSQLNALGLSIFLARAELLASPIVVLDDPIPGSDADHRLTFVQNTLGRMLDNGTQVILTTFDSKLAEWSQANHDWRELVAYDLNLLDVLAGTEPTQTSDAFSRFLLEAEENLNAPTPRGRRAACGSFRSAAERLAKQIIATGRSQEGHATSVDDVDNEAAVLGKLVPLVIGYALDNAEKGQWRTFATVLNPGNHDDDVPSTAELKQVRGNLRKIAKSHRAHWPDGLLL